MQSSTGRSHFKTAAWRPKRDRQLRQRAPSEELGGPIILLLLLRHIGEWSCAARTIDESGYESNFACDAGSQFRDCASFPFSPVHGRHEVGPISTPSVFGGVFCSVKRTRF
jgi:hypothetical protein